jgi:hypothetical protein
MRTTEPTLGRDASGAIMVSAVFMAAVLVGALWAAVGIGDAVLHHQSLQSSADAVAFTGAVYHARGMNLIALINVVMSGIMAVLVALKLVAALNLAALVLSCSASALCSVGVGCWAVPICAFTGDLKPEIDSATEQYQRTVVDTLLPALSASQRAIALAMPYVAEAKAMAAAEPDAPGPTRSGVIVSQALMPTEGSAVPGLPIEDEDDSDLCARSGALAAQVAFSPFPFASWIAGVTGELVGSFPNYFCSGEGELPLATEDRAVEQQCDLRRQAHEQESDEPFDLDGCRDDMLQNLRHAVGEQDAGLSSGRNAGGDARAKQVRSNARNGNSRLQVWAVAVSSDASVHAADTGVAVAQRRRSRMSRAGTLAVAQAEFYYDTSRAWDDARSEALYNLHWRARLRRWRPGESQTAVVRALGKLLPDLRDLVAGVVNGSVGTDLARRHGWTAWNVAGRASGARCADRGNILCFADEAEVIH